MSEFYDNVILVAQNLIGDFGSKTTVILKRPAGAAVEPISGTRLNPKFKDIRLSAVVTSFADRNIDGTRIKTGDKKVILDNSVEPLTSDMIEIDCVLMTIINVKAIKPAEQVIMYQIQARQ